MTYTRCTTIAIACLLLVLTPVSALAGTSLPTAKTLTNRYAPALDAATFKGRPFNLAEQRGKWVLVFFWSTWCAPCMRSLPIVSHFVKTHSDVTTIGLAVADQGAQRFLATHDVGFPNAPYSASAAVKLTPPVIGLPAVLLIGPDGTLRKTLMGGFSASRLTQAMHTAGFPQSP